MARKTNIGKEIVFGEEIKKKETYYQNWKPQIKKKKTYKMKLIIYH